MPQKGCRTAVFTLQHEAATALLCTRSVSQTYNMGMDHHQHLIIHWLPRKAMHSSHVLHVPQTSNERHSCMCPGEQSYVVMLTDQAHLQAQAQ